MAWVRDWPRTDTTARRFWSGEIRLTKRQRRITFLKPHTQESRATSRPMRQPKQQLRVRSRGQSRPIYGRPARTPHQKDHEGAIGGHQLVDTDPRATRTEAPPPPREGSSRRDWQGHERSWQGVSTSFHLDTLQRRSTYYESARAVGAGCVAAENGSHNTIFLSSAEGGDRRSGGSSRGLKGTVGGVEHPQSDAYSTTHVRHPRSWSSWRTRG